MNTYDRLIDSMPAGLERAVLSVISQRVGCANAVGRYTLVKMVADLGFNAHERQIREAIKQLRRDGHFICSSAGKNGGYWMASDREELEMFGHQEFVSKIADMSETWRKMQKAANERWGTASQRRLF